MSRLHSEELYKSPADIAAELEHQRQQRLRSDLDEQRADANPPGVRIRAWERMHGLVLPADPDHPILDVIAATTHLTLAEIQQEQRSRATQQLNR